MQCHAINYDRNPQYRACPVARYSVLKKLPQSLMRNSENRLNRIWPFPFVWFRAHHSQVCFIWCNESSGSMKSRGFIDLVKDYYLLKNNHSMELVSRVVIMPCIVLARYSSLVVMVTVPKHRYNCYIWKSLRKIFTAISMIKDCSAPSRD